MKKNNFNILVAGFATFSMFFGSGNLVFPLQIGVTTGDHFGYAALGLFITGIIIPFIGLFSVLVNATSSADVLTRIGRVPGLILIFLMLSLMGPFGVGARCVLVAYGGVQLLFPNLPLFAFGAVFCAITGYIIWRRHVFVGIIGRFLTPILLGGITVIILFGLFFGGKPLAVDYSPLETFKIGFNFGYQTMDLLAAFFFSGAALEYLKYAHEGVETKKELILEGIKASMIGITLLAIVYGGFVILGAQYAPILKTVAPEQMLTQIAGQALGVFAIPIMAVTVLLACLTTLIVLVNLFAEFTHEHILKTRYDIHWSIIATLLITFLVSLFGFYTLAVWIDKALSFAYPALIAFALASIICDLAHWNHKVVQRVFYLSLIIVILYHVLV